MLVAVTPSAGIGRSSLAPVPQEVIVGQQRVLGLLAFFVTPFVLLAVPGVPAGFLIATVVGIGLLSVQWGRSVGIGLLIGTATLGGLLLLAALLGGAD